MGRTPVGDRRRVIAPVVEELAELELGGRGRLGRRAGA